MATSLVNFFPILIFTMFQKVIFDRQLKFELKSNLSKPARYTSGRKLKTNENILIIVVEFMPMYADKT